jgi:Fuc2NAc and GlcNAc transferase
MPSPFFFALATFTCAAAGVWLTFSWSHRAGRLALPGERDSHDLPTATGGGLGMMLALLLCSWVPGPWPALPQWWLVVAMPAVLVLCLLGWRDDHHQLAWRLRLAVQVAVSLVLLVCLPMVSDIRLTQLSPGLSAMPVWSGGTLILLYLVWMMNATNFMDGSNGLAASQGIFASLLLAWLAQQAGNTELAMAGLAVAAVCAGFLPWNSPRARIFMGDAGSVPLGFVLAVLSIAVAAGGVLPWPAVLLATAVFWLDATLTLLVRVVRGERWYTAHRQHLYQKLVDNGLSHLQVLLVYQGINWLILGPCIWFMVRHPQLVWPMTGTLMLLMVAAWTIASLKLGKALERL